MKGLILAAGKGTRLRPLTDGRSKPMVTLANRPLIHYAIDKLVEIGVTDIGIVVGENEAELKRNLSYPGADLTYIRQPEPKGLAHAVSFARDFTGEDDFILLFCDNLFSTSLHNSFANWNSRDPNCECLLHVYQVADPRACGVAVVNGGWVQELEEKPQQPKSNLAIVGIDFFTPNIYEAIARIKPSARGELEITDAMAELITMGYGVRAEEIDGYWFDTGTFGDLISAQATVMDQQALRVEQLLVSSTIEGNVGIPADCTITGAHFAGPAIIGRGCVIQDSNIGPNVAIADGCRIVRCELQNAQVYSDTALSDVKAAGVIFEGASRINID